jgi:ribosome-binding factor A
MEGKHKARVEETIHQLVAGMLIRKIKDPRVANVSIIRVEASRDYSVAKIYYNVIGSGGLEDVKKGLESCKGFMRNALKKELRIRVIPELVFIYDSTLDRAMALEELIIRIHEEEPPAGEGGLPGEGNPESVAGGETGGDGPEGSEGEDEEEGDSDGPEGRDA